MQERISSKQALERQPWIPSWRPVFPITVKVYLKIGRMFHLELGVDLDRGFLSGFSPPDIFRPFSVIGSARKLSESVAKSVSFHRKTQDKNPPQNPSQNPALWAEKSIAKSVTATRKIRRNSTQLRRAPYFKLKRQQALQSRRRCRIGALQGQSLESFSELGSHTMSANRRMR